MKLLLRAIQHLWCLPTTLGALCVIGLLASTVALLRRLGVVTPLATQDNVAQHAHDLNVGPHTSIWITSPSIRLLLHHHPSGAMEAAVTGHLVWCSQPMPELPAKVRAHELAHVRQSLRWGPIFPIAYLAASAQAKARGQHPYWDNPFEIDARAAEDLVL
jgi:hypothetical protein